MRGLAHFPVHVQGWLHGHSISARPCICGCKLFSPVKTRLHWDQQMFIEVRVRTRRLSLSSRCFLSSRSKERHEAVEDAGMAGGQIALQGRWRGWARGGDTRRLHGGSGWGWGLRVSVSWGKVAPKRVVCPRPRVAPGGVYAVGKAHL